MRFSEEEKKWKRQHETELNFVLWLIFDLWRRLQFNEIKNRLFVYRDCIFMCDETEIVNGHDRNLKFNEWFWMEKKWLKKRANIARKMTNNWKWCWCEWLPYCISLQHFIQLFPSSYSSKLKHKKKIQFTFIAFGIWFWSLRYFCRLRAFANIINIIRPVSWILSFLLPRIF